MEPASALSTASRRGIWGSDRVEKRRLRAKSRKRNAIFSPILRWRKKMVLPTPTNALLDLLIRYQKTEFVHGVFLVMAVDFEPFSCPSWPGVSTP